jgi:hypothetical protein
MVNDYGQLMFVGAPTDLSCSNSAMMVTQTFRIFVMTLALLLVTGCQTKGPTPKEGAPSSSPAQVGTTETGGAHPATGTQDPHAGMATGTQDPHAGMAPPQDVQDVQAVADASGMLDVGAIAFKVPDNLQMKQPKSSMRRAQFSAPGAAGPAELVVYFFGPQGAGTTKDNIDRWVGQFSNADGSPVSDSKQSTSKVSGFDVTRVEVAGQFESGMAPAGQPEAAKGGQRMIAAIVETSGGPYYVKFIGPNATVAEYAGSFDALIASIVASP